MDNAGAQAGDLRSWNRTMQKLELVREPADGFADDFEITDNGIDRLFVMPGIALAAFRLCSGRSAPGLTECPPKADLDRA